MHREIKKFIRARIRKRDLLCTIKKKRKSREFKMAAAVFPALLWRWRIGCPSSRAAR